MTTRFKGLYVTLEVDIREDDAKDIIDAIGMIRGVADVTGDAVDYDDYSARTRARLKLEERIMAVLREEPGK